MPGEILLSRWKPPAGHRLEDQLDRVGVQVAYNDIGPGQPLGAQLLHEGFQGVGQYPHIANGQPKPFVRMLMHICAIV